MGEGRNVFQGWEGISQGEKVCVEVEGGKTYMARPSQKPSEDATIAVERHQAPDTRE